MCLPRRGGGMRKRENGERECDMGTSTNIVRPVRNEVGRTNRGALSQLACMSTTTHYSVYSLPVVNVTFDKGGIQAERSGHFPIPFHGKSLSLVYTDSSIARTTLLRRARRCKYTETETSALMCYEISVHI